MLANKHNIPKVVLRPVPLFLYQPMLKRVVRQIAEAHPDLFSRLGDNAYKAFLIDPTNMPFVLLLHPDPDVPRLRAYRSELGLDYDASITGTFLTLLNMVDGLIDGDAIFFTRDLVVEGDIEAVVALRNALDNIDGSIADEIADIYGAAGRSALSLLRKVRVGGMA